MKINDILYKLQLLVNCSVRSNFILQENHFPLLESIISCDSRINTAFKNVTFFTKNRLKTIKVGTF